MVQITNLENDFQNSLRKSLTKTCNQKRFIKLFQNSGVLQPNFLTLNFYLKTLKCTFFMIIYYQPSQNSTERSVQTSGIDLLKKNVIEFVVRLKTDLSEV